MAMADGLPFRKQAGSTRQMASVPGDIGPFKGDNGQGGAPAGDFFSERELPVRPTDVGSPFKEGFRPTDANPPLPAPGSCDGDPLPPKGNPGY